MLLKTEGFVIKNTKYSETSVISKIYTRHLGMQTYMINGVRSPKAAIKPSLLQLMMPLDLNVYHNNTREIQRIKEARSLFPVQSLHFDVVKSSIALFVAELIYKSVKEEEPNAGMFDFILAFVKLLDSTEQNLSLFPLYFALQLSRFLGFFPQPNYSKENSIFLLHEGNFSDSPGLGIEAVTAPDSMYLAQLMEAALGDLPGMHIPRASRQFLLQMMMDYYALHMPGFQPLKSLGIVTNVLRED